MKSGLSFDRLKNLEAKNIWKEKTAQIGCLT
jgi:hypothetical protein